MMIMDVDFFEGTDELISSLHIFTSKMLAIL